MNPPFVLRRRPQGVALVLVLAFVVLLTGLIVAYFSRSITSRQLSNHSAGQMRSSMMAQSAADTIIAGFKQEIKTGSTVPMPIPNATPANLYIPTTNANAVPVRYPTPAPNANPADPIPNLVRESVRGDSMNGTLPSPAVASYASALNSTNDASPDGRKVTAARWNSHFLIPSQSTAAATDSTPDAAVNFTPPDWVLLSRNGPAVQSAVGSGSGALNDPTASNGNFVVGRYAYAVYDEGGLLDMNVAGHPTPAGTAAQTGFTSTQIGRKGSLALADLTQLPLIKNPATTTDYLAQSMVDAIVGWRNYASAGLSGSSYPNFTFTPAQATNWFTRFASNNSSGFLKVYGGDTSNVGATDQAFLSRQQLLKLRASLGFGANSLQYMGTFSRSLEQPSYVPAHLLFPSVSPSINSVNAAAPPGAGQVDTYQGNNDQAGTSGTSATQDVVNPSLLTVRVPTTVSQGRNDGSDLILGEPLLKKRFSLQRLSWLTYKGPSANNLADPNVRQLITAMGGDPNSTSDPIYQLVAQGTPTNIQKYFGLTWSTGTGATDPPGWTYNHGGAYIMTLSQVATAGREPDFAELLKGTINAGSLAKGGPNLHPEQNNYQYVIDTAVDYNVLQIVANLVDQFDLDSYPTIIKIAAGSVTRYFRGVEDLPYFYRYHPMTVVSELPVPLLPASSSVTFTDSGSGATATASPCAPAPASGFDPGKFVFLYIPDVWNPHDPGFALSNYGSSTAAALRPARFRLAVITTDPTQQTPSWDPWVQLTYNGMGTVPFVSTSPVMPTKDTATALGTEAATAFTFSDDGGKLYREPTLLYRTDVPTNSAIAIDSGDSGSLAGPYKDANTSVSYYGVQIASSPVSFLGTPPASYSGNPSSQSQQYVFQANQYNLEQNVPSGAYAQYTFRLQYQDPNGTGKWVTYDEKYPDFHGLPTPPTMVLDKSQFANDSYMNFWTTGQMRGIAPSYDPRTARFGVGNDVSLEDDGTSAFEERGAYNNENATTKSNNDVFAYVKPTIMPTHRPGSDRGDHIQYSNPGMTSDPGRNPQMHWFGGIGYSASNGANAAPTEWGGLLAQNDAQVRVLARDNGTVTNLYYEDADGMDRRGMGSYAYVPPNGSTLTATYLPTLTEGMPEAIAQSYAPLGYGVGTPTVQNLSRPIVLNRPFRSVAEMSYASRGGVWKQLDFFTPESGDAALLDVFCIVDPPANPLVAGKVNLNTHQTPVLKAIVAGTARDELNSLTNPPGYQLSGLTNDEASNAAARLTAITTDTTRAWRGPLANIGDLVGRFVNTTPPTTSPDFTDYYTYAQPATDGGARTFTYAGLSAALDSTVYTATAGATTPYSLPSGSTVAYNANDNYRIQRMRGSVIRALSDSGQTRVWNLLIDVVAQSGRYGPNASSLPQFAVDGESRCWIHVAIDRYTGEVLDKQVEIVNE